MGLDPKQFEGVEWLRKLGIHVDNNSVRVDAHFGSNASAAPPSVPVIDVSSHEEESGPDQHVEHDTQSDETEPVRKQARKDFINDVDMFCNLWLTAATGALAVASEIEDPESTEGWWIALAGNLLWATTCLIPEAHVVTLAVMSFGGAAAGSGVFSPGSKKAPSGKEMINGMLTQARDKMVDAATPIMDLAATQCGDKQINDRQEQRQVLWRNLFNTPFDKADPIRQQMKAKIEGAMKSYNDQWKAWKGDVYKAAEQLAIDHQTGKGRFKDFVGPDELKQAAKDHPFKPKLSFG